MFCYTYRLEFSVSVHYRHVNKSLDRAVGITVTQLQQILTMADVHRKIELQEQDDLRYLINNARRRASEKIDEALPPIQGEDALRSRVEELVHEVSFSFPITALFMMLEPTYLRLTMCDLKVHNNDLHNRVREHRREWPPSLAHVPPISARFVPNKHRPPKRRIRTLRRQTTFPRRRALSKGGRPPRRDCCTQTRSAAPSRSKLERGAQRRH